MFFAPNQNKVNKGEKMLKALKVEKNLNLDWFEIPGFFAQVFQFNFLVLQCSEMIMPFAFGQHCQQPPERPQGQCKCHRGIPWCCVVKSPWRP